MQLRNSGVGVVACSPKEPQNPVKPLGSLSGSFSSPRLAMKMRLGVSAKIPPVDPQMYPGLAYASGCGQFCTTSYGPVRSSPPFSWSDAGALTYPTPTTATSESKNVRMRTLPCESHYNRCRRPRLQARRLSKIHGEEMPTAIYS